MLTIIYDRAGTCLTVTGHAGYAPAGQDIVCAAVSALVCTLAENVKERAGAAVSLAPGESRIACQGAGAAFDVIARGCALLARQYPAYVRYAERGAAPMPHSAVH